MKRRVARLTPMLRVTVAALALLVMSDASVVAYEGNVCSGCQELSNLECGIRAAFIIDSCCGNFVDGFTQCVAGYGYAVACETGVQCMCNSQGEDCTWRVPG